MDINDDKSNYHAQKNPVTQKPIAESRRYNDDAGVDDQTKRPDIVPQCGGAMTLAISYHSNVVGAFLLTTMVAVERIKIIKFSRTLGFGLGMTISCLSCFDFGHTYLPQ